MTDMLFILKFKCDICNMIHEKLASSEEKQFRDAMTRDGEDDILLQKSTIQIMSQHFHFKKKYRGLVPVLSLHPNADAAATTGIDTHARASCEGALKPCNRHNKKNDVSHVIKRSAFKKIQTFTLFGTTKSLTSKKENPQTYTEYNIDDDDASVKMDENDTRDKTCHVPQHQLLPKSSNSLATKKPRRRGKK